MQINVADIMNWSINRFNEILKACDRLIHYKIYRSAEMSGMVSFKNGIPIQSWLKNADSTEGQMRRVEDVSSSFGNSIK